jgi:hypothetical protein
VKVAGEACKLHGGATPRGAASPHYSGKGYSKYLPVGMREQYEEFANDAQRLELTEEIALARALLSENVKTIAEIDTETAWKEAQKYYTLGMKARKQGKREKANEHFTQLGELLTRGTDQNEKIKSALVNMDTVRRLIDTQRQIYVDKGELVSRALIILVLDAILEAIGIYVKPLEGGQEAIRKVGSVIREFTDAGISQQS